MQQLRSQYRNLCHNKRSLILQAAFEMTIFFRFESTFAESQSFAKKPQLSSRT